MERITKLTKNLKNIDTKLLQTKILLLVYDEIKYQKQLDYLTRLLDESTNLLTEFNETKSSNTFNYIDNNCFEMEQLIEDLKVELDKFIRVDAFVFLNNKTLDELKEMYEYYLHILENEGTIFNAIRKIKSASSYIIKEYTKHIYDYLESNESPKVLSLLNVTYIDQILNHFLITASDWSQVYKMTKLVIKSIENKTNEFINILSLQKEFEYAYFLIMVGE